MNKIVHFKIICRNIRFIAILVIVAIFVPSQSGNVFAADNGNGILSQQIKDRKVTLNLKNKTLDEVLTELSNQVKISHGYHTSVVIDPQKRYTIIVNNESLESVMKRLLTDSDYGYTIDSNKIIIFNKVKVKVPQMTRFHLKGRVIIKHCGEPAIGGTVIIAETGKGAIVDSKGYFELDVMSGDRLEFSFTGTKTQYITVTGPKESFVVELEATTMNIDEVVISSGYGNIKEKLNTGSVTTIKADAIKIAGLNTIDKMLEGHVPGMIFMQNSGQAGASSKLRIRGTSTIIGNQEPLWVVDGVVQQDPVKVDPARLNDLDFVNLLGNAISGLNPENIEQIDVLKDASATAIYGVRAANGVIVITTKKGMQGKPVFRYTMDGTFTRRPYYSDKTIMMMNSKERIDVSREQFDRGAELTYVPEWFGYEKAYLNYINRNITFDDFQRETSRYETMNTDWFDILARNSFSHKHTFSISGGSPNIQYYASIGYNDEKGVIRKEKNETLTSYFKLNGTYERFNFQFTSQFSKNDRHYTPESKLGKSIIQYAYEMSRAVPAYDEAGERFFYKYGNLSNLDFAFPFNMEHEMDTTHDNVSGHTAAFAINFDYKLWRNLKIEGLASYSVGSTNQETVFYEDSYYVKSFDQSSSTSLIPYGGEWRGNDTRNKAYTARAQLVYSGFVDQNEKHMVSAMLGAELSSSAYNTVSKTERGYYPDRGRTFANLSKDYLTGNMVYAHWAVNNHPTITDHLTNLGSVYVSATYGYDDRYVINFNSRIDASNQFGSRSNEKLLPIWSIGGRWNIKNDILKNSNAVSDFALLFSYGKQGNMLDNQTSRMIISKGAFSNYYGGFSSTVAYYPNPDLRWEITDSYNAQLQFSLLKNKISGTLAYYYKKTTDAFLTKKVSEVNGIDSYVVNSGTVTNQGVEVSLSFTPFNQKVDASGRRGFVWRFDPQFGQVVNNLVNKAINNKTHTVRDRVTFRDYLNGNVEIPGKPMHTFYSYRFKGLNGTNGVPMFYNLEEERSEELKTKYLNMRDEEICMEVMSESGTRMPILQGGLSNYFGYRQFGLSFNFSYSLGNKIRLLKLCDNNNVRPFPFYNVRQEFTNRWRKPGDEKHTNIPALVTSISTPLAWWYSDLPGKDFATDYSYDLYDDSDLRVVKGDYFKLQSLSFTYNFKDELCKKLSLKSAYISFSGTNLFTIASPKLKGQDVMQSGSANTINLSVRPTYSFTLNVSF